LKQEIICTVCPLGCNIAVEGTKKEITLIEGYSCNRGKTYASQEFLHPERILTTTVKVNGGVEELVAVRSDRPIPKELIMECMAEINSTTIEAPIYRYDKIISNICRCGANIIATGNME